MEQNIIDRIKSNWNEVLDYIRNEFEIAEISFNIWISPLKPKYMEKDENGGHPRGFGMRPVRGCAARAGCRILRTGYV